MEDERSFHDNVVVQKKTKRRSSIFNPNKCAQVNKSIKDTTANEIYQEYIDRLQNERKQWMEEYEKIKVKNTLLKKSLGDAAAEEMDLSLLSEEEMLFAFDRPDYSKFFKEMSELHGRINIRLVQHQRFCSMKRAKYLHMEDKIHNIENVPSNFK